MKSRLLLLMLLCVGFVGLLVFYRPPGESGVSQTAQTESILPTVPEPEMPFADDSIRTLAELRERSIAKYRPLPDRRFLMAVGDLQRWIAGADSAVDARFESGRWRITSGSTPVATLPEYPGFEDLEVALTQWAQSLAERHRFKLSHISRPNRELRYALDRLDAIEALRHSDAQWASGKRDVVLARRTTQALTLLTLQAVDEVGVGESIPARAFAALALTRAFSRDSLDRDEALLADVMGYHAFAESRAARLPANDPVRAFVTRDDSTLSRIARRAVTLEAPFFHLVRLARSRELEAWRAWAVHRFGESYAQALPVLSTGLWCRKFEAHIPSAVTTLDALSQTLVTQGFKSPGLLAKIQGRAAGELIDEFERAIAVPRPEVVGPFLDATLLQAYDRALFYTSFERIGHHLRESLSSTEATQWFSRAATPKSDNAVARAFHAWYLHLAEAKSGRADPADLMGDLGPRSPLGAQPALDTYESFKHHVELGNPLMRSAVSRLAARLDTRPDHLWRLAAVTRTDIAWLSFSEGLHAAAANGSGHHEGRLLAYVATLHADWDSLSALLNGPLPLEERFQALEFVASAPGVDPATLERAYRGFIAEAPRAWTMTKAYVSWLEQRKEFAKARAAIERWRAVPGRDTTGFDEIFSTTALARLYRRDGQAARGLAVLGDLDASFQFGAMAEKAYLLAALDRFDDAERVATRALKRYPDHAGARTLCAEIAWQAGRNDQAAVALTQGTYRLTATDWAWTIAPAFARAFDGEPARAGQALQAMMKAGLRGVSTVGALARPFADQGHPDQAFAIQSQLQVSGLQKYDVWIMAYVYLKAWRGEADALEWLKRKVPEDQRAIFTMFAFQEGCDELLWTLAPAVVEEQHQPYQWLMQAAALARNPSLPHRVDFKTDLEVNRSNYYLKIARFLAGLVPESEAIEAARGKKARCEAYYFIGLKAETEGRFRDAADWYSLSAETGAVSNGEYRWSMKRLFQLGGADRALDTMKAKRGPS